jgi:ABC-type transport system substrate-binding protein
LTVRDRAVVLVLVAVFAVLTIAIAVPAPAPVAVGSGAPSGSPSAPGGSPLAATYREGIVGRPASIDPLTAETQADRDIVALVFSGLSRLGPDGTVVPDLASGWTIGSKGKSYTFTIRPDARWHDGQPVTSADVVFTIHALQDPTYTGPGASSWREVTVTAVDDLTVRFDLATALGSFLEATTQPLLPEHLLTGVLPADLATAPFNNAPVGSGPYRLVSWDTLAAHLEPATTGGGSPSPGPSASGSSTSASPSVVASVPPTASASPRAPATPRPSAKATARPRTSPSARPSASSSPSPTPTPAPTPPPGSVTLPAIDLHFYLDPATLMADYRAGLLDAASGLSPTDAGLLAADPGSRLLSYPRTTYTSIVLDQRPSHPLFASLAVRTALLQAIDRPGLIATVLGGAAQLAASPIPPSSWAYAPGAAPNVKYDPAAASKALKAANWKKTTKGWQAPGAKKRFSIELITPNEASNPTLFATTNAVADDWRRFGIAVTVTALTPHDFVDSRLAPGHFDAAVVDLDVGLDPDLYPFLASTQTTTGGANVSGIQLAALDVKLAAARTYGSQAARIAAFKDLQVYLGQNILSLPLFFRDAPFVVRDRVFGPTPREIADPSGRYWDVLTWRLASGQ